MDSVISLIKLLEKRTTMYITKSDVHCLKAFIDGWVFRNAEAAKDVEIMNRFQVWMEEKYSIHATFSWASIIAFYSIDYKDEIPLFFANFNEFISTLQNLK